MLLLLFETQTDLIFGASRWSPTAEYNAVMQAKKSAK